MYKDNLKHFLYLEEYSIKPVSTMLLLDLHVIAGSLMGPITSAKKLFESFGFRDNRVVQSWKEMPLQSKQQGGRNCFLRWRLPSERNNIVASPFY
ncbi:hypothetical protein QFZ77_007596 [Paenibacillus sp. V4I3]|nr:hypothetical protein [Paenibacillus sp. V4I3]MDQ0885337.1 hypothetical protein [Paenibacillus sp. V4I9]